MTLLCYLIIFPRCWALCVALQYKDVVVFSDRADLLKTVSKYLFDDAARLAMERKALQFALNMQQDLDQLEEALVDIMRDSYFAGA